MLLKHLSDDDKRTFLQVAELLSLADKPIVWDGKPRLVTAYNKHAKASFQRSEDETTAIADLTALLLRSNGFFLFRGVDLSLVGGKIIARIEPMEPRSEDDPDIRSTVAVEVLQELLAGKESQLPSVPKLMLFELMMLALSVGSISEVQWRVLRKFGSLYQIEEFILDELLERAQSTHVEAQKNIALILE